MTVILKRVEDPLEFGIVITGEDGRIERFLEKPGWGEVFSDTINTGIYVVEREVLDYIPPGEEFDFSHDLFPLLLDKGLPMYGYVTERQWTDVGNLEAYLRAHWDVLDRKSRSRSRGSRWSGGVWLGHGRRDRARRERRGSGLHRREQPDRGRRRGPRAHRSGAERRGQGGRDPAAERRPRQRLHRAATRAFAGCVIGKNTDVKAGARLEEGVVVADECYVGEGAVPQPSGQGLPLQGRRPRRDRLRVDHLAVGGRPEPVRRARGGRRDERRRHARDGAAAGRGLRRVLPKRSVVAACRDASRTARIMKRAMVAGANSSGVDCNDLELVPIPVARFYARSTRALGGFAVRSSAVDASSVEIQFFDERGLDLDPATERKLERIYYRDDLRRAFQPDIGELSFPARGREFYVRGVLDAVDAALIRGAGAQAGRGLRVRRGLGDGPADPRPAGRDVLSANAVIDEDRAVLSREERRRARRDLARLVRSSGAEVGAMIDAVGEKLRLVDGGGACSRRRSRCWRSSGWCPRGAGCPHRAAGVDLAGGRADRGRERRARWCGRGSRRPR